MLRGSTWAVLCVWVCADRLLQQGVISVLLVVLWVHVNVCKYVCVCVCVCACERGNRWTCRPRHDGKAGALTANTVLRLQSHGLLYTRSATTHTHHPLKWQQQNMEAPYVTAQYRFRVTGWPKHNVWIMAIYIKYIYIYIYIHCMSISVQALDGERHPATNPSLWLRGKIKFDTTQTAIEWSCVVCSALAAVAIMFCQSCMRWYRCYSDPHKYNVF